MPTIINTIVGGVIATTAMTLFLYLFHWFKLANGDMLRALGSWVVKKYEGSFLPGLIIHYIGGICFALIYLWLWRLLPLQRVPDYIFLGLVFGFIHGLIVSFMLVVLVAEHHPMEEFRGAGFAVALVHLVAHIIYGAVLGLVVGSTVINA